MKVKFIINVFLNFYFTLVLNAGLEAHNGSVLSLLMEMQEQYLSEFRNRPHSPYIVDISFYLTLDPIDLLKAMELMDDCFFVLFWDSFGIRKRISWNEIDMASIIHEVNQCEDCKHVFKNMKKNYKMYLDRVIFTYTGDQIALINQAMCVYYGKFRSIWRKFGQTKTVSLGRMRQVFQFYQEAAGQDIYSLMEMEFIELFRSLEGNNHDLIMSRQKRFCSLVQCLSANEKEKLGLEWIANHHDPYLTLFYLFYQVKDRGIHRSFISSYKRNRITQIATFTNAVFFFKKISNYGIIWDGKHFKFFSSFKSSLPKIIGDSELKDIISKIVPKLLKTIEKFGNNPEI
jgi:hypothetical protein